MESGRFHALVLLVLGCLFVSGGFLLNTYATGRPDMFYVYDVPFVSQTQEYWCGPASLAMVLNYWGTNVTQEQIAASIYDPATNLTSISGMKNYPLGIDFEATELNASIESLKDWICRGVPVIALQRFSFQDSYGHYRVVIGYNDKKEEVETFDPILGSNYNLTYVEFAELWKPGVTFTTFDWALVVIPHNSSLPDLIQKYQLLLNEKSSPASAPDNSQLLNIFLTAALTVLGGVIVYSLGQLISRFVIEPIHRQDEIRGEIADALIFYANLYSNPANTPAHLNAGQRMRQLSSLLISRTTLIREYGFFSRLGLVPMKADIVVAHRNLVLLSNCAHLTGYATQNFTASEETKKRLKI